MSIAVKPLLTMLLLLATVLAGPLNGAETRRGSVVIDPSLHILDAPLNAAYSEDQSAYRLGPGDKLQISVFNQEDLSGGYTINGSGRFSMPLIGTLTAAGNTAAELEELIVNKLKPDYLKNPRVSIEVLNYRPFYILGEVKTPNSYPYVDGMTYMNAVAIAGGFTYRAKKGHALVKRNDDPDGEEIEVKMNELVMPGDIIRIDERFF